MSDREQRIKATAQRELAAYLKERAEYGLEPLLPAAVERIGLSFQRIARREVEAEERA